MSLNLKSLVHQSLGVLFGLGSDVAQEVTFCRPVGFNSVTGLFAATDSAVGCQVLIAGYRPFELGAITELAANQKFIVRTADLASVSAPGAGDYFLMAGDGQRWDVLAGAQDHLGEYWLFYVQRSSAQDFGGLTVQTVSEDRGDLTAAGALDDFGTLT